MKAVHLQHNLFYNMSYYGNVCGATGEDIINGQVESIMGKCPWVDEPTIRGWLSRPHMNFITNDRFDQVLAAIQTVLGLEITVFDLPEEVEAKYNEWVAAGKPGKRAIMDPKTGELN